MPSSAPTRTARRRVRHWAAIAAVATTVLIAACGDDAGTKTAASGFKSVAPPTLVPGQTVPAPEGKRVLTLTGVGAASNSRDGLVFDAQSLEALGVVEGSLYEPFEKKRMKFAGVELSRVVQVAGVPADARLHLVALDDYQVDLTMDEVMKGGILLATRLDGAPLAVEHGGPSRIVFLDGNKSGRDTRQWIWSVDRIEVRR